MANLWETQGEVSKRDGSPHLNTVPGPAKAKCSGWIMSTWKAENADEWFYEAELASDGWIPSNPISHKYPNICG